MKMLKKLWHKLLSCDWLLFVMMNIAIITMINISGIVVPTIAYIVIFMGGYTAGQLCTWIKRDKK